jgi:spermidine synthase
MPSVQVNEEEGVRYLQFGAHWIQGAMRLSHPWALELEYARDMMLPLLLRGGNRPRSVLTIGLGAGSITKFLYRYVPAARLEVVEIDPEVILAAWTFFKLPAENRRLRIEIGDGYKYVAGTRRRYDLILLDGFDAKVEAGNLDSPAFYKMCKARLNPGGIVATNLVSRRGRPKESIARIGKVFDGRVLVLPPNGANTIAIATIGSPIRIGSGQLRSSARKLRSTTGLNLLPTVTSLGDEDLRL